MNNKTSDSFVFPNHQVSIGIINQDKKFPIGKVYCVGRNYNEHIKEKVQGINDFIVFGFVAIGSMLSGGILNCFSSDIKEGWFWLNLLVIFKCLIIFLVLALKIKSFKKFKFY